MTRQIKPKSLSGSRTARAGLFSPSTISREESVPNTAQAVKKLGRQPQDMVVPAAGRIIDAKYRWIYELDLAMYIDKTDLLEHNKDLLKRFVSDARAGKTIKRGAKKKVDKPRLIKYVQDLKKLDKYFRIPLDAITGHDMERFINDLEEGRLKKSDNKPYSVETQVCTKKIIIKFYKWLNDGKVPAIVEWIDTSYKVKDYRAPREEQIRAVLDRMTSNHPDELIRNRALIMVLFDSGARADELGNVRLEHLVKDESGNYRMRIEYSKTKARTISLPLASEYLEKWLLVHPQRQEPQAQLFPVSYTAMHHLVARAGKRAGLKITPHALRHASATYWGRHLSRYQMNTRMGWAMSSKQPDRYIDQEGLGEEKVVQIVEQTNVQRLKNENDGLNRRLALLEEQLNRLMQADKEELRQIIRKVIDES